MPMNQWLTELCPENAVLLNRVDAEKLGLRNGDRVRLGSATNPDGPLIWEMAKCDMLRAPSRCWRA